MITEQFTKDHLDPFLEKIQEYGDSGVEEVMVNVNDLLIIAEHNRDLEETIEVLEEKLKQK